MGLTPKLTVELLVPFISMLGIVSQMCVADGIKFFKSANGVILTPGDEQGFLKPKYFKKIVDAKTGRVSLSVRRPRPRRRLDAAASVALDWPVFTLFRNHMLSPP